MTIELTGDNLKYKYRCNKPKGTNPAREGGSNKAYRVRGIVPTGLRRNPKGKTRFP
jgi:hypothetical protein